MHVVVTNNAGSELSLWGCPEECGPLGVKIASGSYFGWNEPRSGVAYTVALHGVQVACPPVIPQTASSRRIYLFVQPNGTCTVGPRPIGDTTPE